MSKTASGHQAGILAELAESSRVIAGLKDQAPLIEKMGRSLIEAFRRGNKMLTFGNGGSACDAQNFADELVGRFCRNRPPLPALALTVNQADLTSIANDFGYDHVFARQIEAHGRKGDIAVAISTSGNSPNVLRAVEAARKLGLFTLGFSGETGGKMRDKVDLCLCVPCKSTARVQEAHITVIQILCGMVEEALFSDVPKIHD
jgi:D-sedoheptulose 7-phosphate isomerase